MTASKPTRPPSTPSTGPSVAGRALLATLLLYGAYAAAGWAGLPGDLRYLGLVAGFYFLPGWMLRHDPERQARYQIGPDRVLPPWHAHAVRHAAVVALAVFPLFVLGFWTFYGWACVEAASPGGGALARGGSLGGFVARLCEAHPGGWLPPAVRWPASWIEYGGLGAVLAVVIEVFAVALPEELFHRGYLMSALEERWPPRRRWFGVPFGVAAVVSSALFALGHLVGMAELARLATFFPALLFAWLWRKSNTLWAPTLLHAASNLLMALLFASTFPR